VTGTSHSNGFHDAWASVFRNSFLKTTIWLAYTRALRESRWNFTIGFISLRSCVENSGSQIRHARHVPVGPEDVVEKTGMRTISMAVSIPSLSGLCLRRLYRTTSWHGYPLYYPMLAMRYRGDDMYLLPLQSPSRMRSAAFSAIAYTVACGCVPSEMGMMLASTTLRLLVP